MIRSSKCGVLIAVAVFTVAVLPLRAQTKPKTAKPKPAATNAKPPAAKPAPVKLITNAAETDVKLTVASPSLDSVIFVAASGDQTATVKASPAQLLGAATAVDLTCTVNDAPCANPFTIAPKRPVPLRLTATLPKTGTYVGVLDIAGEGTAPLRLTITAVRTDAPFPLQVINVDKAASGSGTVTVRVSLQETSHTPQVMNKPELIVFSHADPGGKGKQQASGFTATALDTNEQAIATPWEIPANAPVTLMMKFEKLCFAGEYSGIVRITSPNTNSYLNVPVTIWIREPGWLAAILIAVGVGISYGLRTYLRSVRPRIAQQRRAMMLLDDLSKVQQELEKTYGALAPIETAIVDDLSQRAGDLSNGILSGDGTDADATLIALRDRLSKISRWVLLRRQIEALPEAIRTTLEPELAKVTKYLQFVAEKADADAALAALPTKIEDTQKTEVRDRAKKIRDAVAASKFFADAKRQDAAKAAVEKELAALEDQLKMSRFDQARAAVLAAEAAYLTSLGEELRVRLTAQAKTPPLGFTETTWDVLTKDVTGALPAASASAEERIRGVQTAFQKYVAGLAAALETFARDRVLTLIETDPHLKPNAAELKASLESALQLVASARAAANALDMEKASNDIAAATAAFVALRARAQKLGVMMKAADEAEPGAAPPAPAIDFGPLLLRIFGVHGTRDPHLARDRADALLRLSDRLDLLVLFAALAGAIGVGLLMLWANNPTWGSWNDYLIAFLWGLGLHQVAGTTIDGISGVLAKYS